MSWTRESYVSGMVIASTSSNMFDFIIRNGRLVTASEILPEGLDLGIRNGKIAYIGLPLPNCENVDTVDADGAYVTPGGVDSHVHIDQGNHPTTDKWENASKSAIAGGTTTVLAFSQQKRQEESLYPSLQQYHAKATGNAYCDYGFHLILSNPTEHILSKELPIFVEQEGITSVKLYMTYDPLKLTDSELLDVMMTTRSLGMTTMIHAENHDMVAMIIRRLERQGHGGPFYHSVARPQIVENEAAYRIISLAELTDTPILIVHMSAETAVKHVRDAQARLLPVHAETCPHYLFLKSDNLAKPDFEGAKFVCSPPLRHQQSDLDAMWCAVANGTFTTLSSDHCPDQFDHPCGKKRGLDADGKQSFMNVPNGLPGIETRLPLLFSAAGKTQNHKMSLPRFVELTSTNPAKLYGLSDRKGSLSPGLDADIVIWHPDGHEFEKGSAEIIITNSMLHHSCDYTPFEGFKISNWPRKVYLRGKLVWDRDNNGILGSKGDGLFLKREKSTVVVGRTGTLPTGMFPGETELWRQ